MLLAIDTSGPCCSSALFDTASRRVIAHRQEEIGRGHAERLLPQIREIFEEAGANWQALSGIGVTTGPGSFTGLRAGLAFARGAALGLEIACTGVPVMEAMALPWAGTGRFQVVMDARRNEVFLQSFDEDALPAGEPSVMSIDAAASLVSKGGARLAGSGAHLLAFGGDIEILSDAASPDIADVARLAADKDPQLNPPAPLYLRSADAKPQSGFALPHAPNAA